MLTIGLTGGIGCGKSTISNIFKEKNIPIIDADVISREVLSLYPNIIINIKREFGDEYIDDQGNLIRKKIGNLIFNDKRLKKKFEDIILPYIKYEIRKRLMQYKSEPICILDAPTLIESKMHLDVDKVILVYVSEDIQIERIKQRDNLTDQQIKDRIDSQLSLNEKKKFADYLINNDHSIEDTKKQVEGLLKDLRNNY